MARIAVVVDGRAGAPARRDGPYVEREGVESAVAAFGGDVAGVLPSLRAIPGGGGNEYVSGITPAGVLTVACSATPDDATFNGFLSSCDLLRRDFTCYFILAGAGAPKPAQRTRSGRRHPHSDQDDHRHDGTPARSAPVAALLQRNRPTQVIRVFLPDERSQHEPLLNSSRRRDHTPEPD